jgi:hypothetical protein
MLLQTPLLGLRASRDQKPQFLRAPESSRIRPLPDRICNVAAGIASEMRQPPGDGGLMSRIPSDLRPIIISAAQSGSNYKTAMYLSRDHQPCKMLRRLRCNRRATKHFHGGAT